MERVSEELREKRGKDSLLDIHGKKLKKKASKQDEDQPKVREVPLINSDVHTVRYRSISLGSCYGFGFQFRKYRIFELRIKFK